MLQFEKSALAIVCAGLAALIEPPEHLTPSQWAARHLIVPDGPRSGERWSAELTPYIVEPLDNMGPDEACNEQAIRKSAQTGFTAMALCGVGHSIDCDPNGGILLVQPTDSALSDFLRDKLNPAIENTPALRAKVFPQVSRSGDGSTAYNKRYPGGSLSLAIANSAADLRSKTKKRVIRDEASEYPDDLDGQGSPHGMIEARRLAFLASGDWKDTAISTPTIVGACYITERYEAGDQRYWHVDCPGCGKPLRFEFGANFRFNDTYPHAPYYAAPCCGQVIEAHEKNELVRAGSRHAPRRADGLPNGWIATAPGPGKPRSYHFDALSSPFVPWDQIARKWIEAQGDPAKLKAFYNLWLGLAYEMKGDAPDHVRLYERREDYRKLHIPPRGLMLTGFADVQLRGIYYEIVAWAPNRESWVIDAGVIAGDTTDHKAGAFADLDVIYRREYPDAFGGRRNVDAFGVDSGFRAHVVYAWCRLRHKAMATKGVDGWHRPAIGTPSLVDIDLDGHKITQGTRIWPIGTWSLKGHWYEDLHRTMQGAVYPPGFVHFGKFLDETYFRQVTAEYLAEKRHRGRIAKAWAVRGKEDNHFLDCRVGNMALADHLGLSRMTDEEWRILARERAAALLDQADMFAPAPLAAQAKALAVHAAENQSDLSPEPSADQDPAGRHAPQDSSDNPESEESAPASTKSVEAGGGDAPSSGWIGRDTRDWLR